MIFHQENKREKFLSTTFEKNSFLLCKRINFQLARHPCEYITIHPVNLMRIVGSEQIDFDGFTKYSPFSCIDSLNDSPWLIIWIRWDWTADKFAFYLDPPGFSEYGRLDAWVLSLLFSFPFIFANMPLPLVGNGNASPFENSLCSSANVHSRYYHKSHYVSQGREREYKSSSKAAANGLKPKMKAQKDFLDFI